MTKIRDIEKVFCKSPWQMLSFRPVGTAAVCYAQMLGPDRGYVKDKDGNHIPIQDSNPQEILNSELHKSIRLSQMRGEWHPHCENCRLFEQANTVDDQEMREKASLGEITQFYKNMHADGSLKKIEIKHLDVRFSNLCNAACLHCRPVESTRWYDDWYGFFGPEIPMGSSKWLLGKDHNNRTILLDQDKISNSDSFWKIIDEHKHTIEKVMMLGGEPLIMKDYYRFLDMFIDLGRANEIEIRCNTNLSVLNPQLFEKWKKFKKIDLSVSIDDVYDRYEIVRYGLKWDRLVNNLRLLKENGFLPGDISTCYMIPNMFRMAEYDRWLETEGFTGHFRYVHGPLYVSVTSLPKSARLELIEYNRKANTPSSVKAANFIEETLSQPEDLEACAEFIRLMDFLDKSRKQDWKNQMPEVYDLLKRHLPAGAMK